MTLPIVLSHGVCRFDQLWNDALGMDNNDNETMDSLHYFKGIRTMLKKKGFQVYHAKVPWAAKVDERAEALRTDIEQILRNTGAAAINIVAHSMGGLDSRRMLFNDRNAGRIHQRVASLTTISTPHWGSSFADWGIRNLGGVITLAHSLGLNIEAFKDLTVAECSRYNHQQAVVEFEKACEQTLKFQTYACRQDFMGIFAPLKLPFYYIEKEEGDNDGLVSVKSARWRDRYFQGILEKTDHINALGWWEADQIFVGESEKDLLTRIHGVYAEIARNLP